MKRLRAATAPPHLVLTLGTALTVWSMITASASAADVNDYPTSARVDYVYACMKANGETRQALEKCSCSIDVVASILPYDRYVAAEALLSLAQIAGERGTTFQAAEESRAILNDLRRAQAEAEVRCF